MRFGFADGLRVGGSGQMLTKSSSLVRLTTLTIYRKAGA